MSELLEFATYSLSPDRAEVLAVAKYLSALNNIFERTIIGTKTRIFDAEGTGIQRLNEGYKYFTEWAEELTEAGEFNSGVDSKQFISWQVHTIVLLYIE